MALSKKASLREPKLTVISDPTIYDQDGNSFTYGAPAIQVGSPPDFRFKVGDTVYLTLNITIYSVLPATGSTWTLTKYDDLSNFFNFGTDSDTQQITVRKILNQDEPVVSIPKDGVVVNLRYLVDFSNLVSGQKTINLLAFTTNPTDSTASSTPVQLSTVTTSEPFYLDQSLSAVTQKTLSDDAGLVPDTMEDATSLRVGLSPVTPKKTDDVVLWESIRDSTGTLMFNNYRDYMDLLFSSPETANGKLSTSYPNLSAKLKDLNNRRKLPFIDTDSYRAVKLATEAFVMANIANSHGDMSNYLKTVYDGFGDDVKIIPYLAIIRNKLSDIAMKPGTLDEALDAFLGKNNGKVADNCYDLITEKLQNPCYLELIWNYWHEESMMVQGLNAISRRFQNIRAEGAIDPLANVEIMPLRPLNNLMWGYIQDEQHRLTVRRRAYEYDHHYGMTIQGKAVQNLRTADSRSKFVEAFHTLLNLCIKFYAQYDDTTVVADGFPVMNALKETHMILSEGAHNQFGDMPSTARIEMMMQQYLLGRPEFRDFLPMRQMVPYPEAWMDRAAVLNQIHNWTRTNVMHYRDLGVFGEQILLSVRYGGWSEVFDRNQAANWAIFWRPQIQNYIHSYRAVTGADLSREDGVVDIQQPSTHLVRRLREQTGNRLRA